MHSDAVVYVQEAPGTYFLAICHKADRKPNARGPSAVAELLVKMHPVLLPVSSCPLLYQVLSLTNRMMMTKISKSVVLLKTIQTFS